MKSALVVAVLAAACGAEIKVSQLDLRAQVVQLDARTLAPDLRARLERGAVWTGASELELDLSRGEPRPWWNTRVGDRACKVLVHANLVEGTTADLAVTTCDGRVVAFSPLTPALPLWRMPRSGPE